MSIRNFWQTINPVRFFSKQQGYLEIPVFTENFTWRGVPTIIGVFNYESANVISITNLLTKPSNPNYIPCIKFRVGNSVSRYRLWDASVDNLNVPLYAGQYIKKNFQIEIWSVSNSGSVSNDAIINIPVSVRRVKSTLEDADIYKATQESAIINQGNLLASLNNNYPLVTTNLVAQYVANVASLTVVPPGGPPTQNGFVTEWRNSLSNNFHLTPVVGADRPFFYNDIAPFGMVRMLGNIGQLHADNPCNGVSQMKVFMMIFNNGWVNNKIIYKANITNPAYDPYQIYQSGVDPNLKSLIGAQQSVANNDLAGFRWQVLSANFGTDPDTMNCEISFKIDDKVETVNSVGGVVPVFNNKIIVGDAEISIAEILIYNTHFFVDEQAIKNYLYNKYLSRMPLPLIYTDSQHGKTN